MGCGCLQAESRHRAGPLLAAAIDEDVLRYQFVKKKGYVRLHTNKGDLNLELHCDMVGVAAIPLPAQGTSGLLYVELHLACACSRKLSSRRCGPRRDLVSRVLCFLDPSLGS